MKVGIVVTLHWSHPNRNQGGYLFDRFLQSIKDSNIKFNFKLYIIDNQSQYKFNLPTNIEYMYTYIDNQLEKGLTGAWNVGLNQAIEDKCDIVINTNDDVKFDSSINYFIDLDFLKFFR